MIAPMKNRIALLVFALPLFCLAGCGGSDTPKTEDPAEIEQIRQKAMENANREQSTSK